MGQLLCRPSGARTRSQGGGRICSRSPCMLCPCMQPPEEPAAAAAQCRPLLPTPATAAQRGGMVCKRRGNGIPSPAAAPQGGDMVCKRRGNGIPSPAAAAERGGMVCKRMGNGIPSPAAAHQGGDMLCKRRSAGLPAATPRKQPRSAEEGGTSQEAPSIAEEEAPYEVNSACSSLHIHQLPPNILLKIFSNLSLNERCLSASPVCRYWRDLCLDFQLWRQLDLSGRQQVTDDVLEKIVLRNKNISEINISDCRKLSDSGLRLLALNCPGLLKYVAVRCKQLSDASLIAIATHCPLLQKVHLGNQDRLTDEGLKQLGSRSSDLKDIHFGQCYNFTDQGMVAIAEGCPKLQKIYMQENKLVTDRSVKAFAEHCPELQYVGFMGCSVTSDGVIYLTKLKHLSSLDLRHITELNNDTVMEIVKRCRSLTSLNLCLNLSINDRCVEVIAKEGQNLKELYLVSCNITDYALIAIGRYSVTIETVDVGWCKEITDKGATQIAQSSKSLEYLGLMRCDKVNEDTVEQLVQQYPRITFSTVLQDCKRTLERAYQMGWTPSTSTAS